MDLLKPVKDEHAFKLSNGRILNSVAELKELVHTMDKSVFSHHVNSERNDFSNWIRDIHGDNSLADSIGKAKTQTEVAIAISNRVKELVAPKLLMAPKKIKKAKSVFKKSAVRPELKSKIKKVTVGPELKPLEKPITIILGAKEEVKINMNGKQINNSEEKPEKYPLHMLTPKATLRENIMPFFKPEENKENLKFEPEKKKHHLDGIKNKDYMKMGAYDFFKGVIFGMIVGALFAVAIV